MRIVLEGVTAGYGERVVLREVGFAVGEGELLSMVGPNGAGKTTLLKVVAGVLRPRAGTVLLDGRPLYTFRPRELAARIAAVAQDPGAGFDFTVRELVELGRLPLLSFPDRLSSADREAVARALELVGLLGMEDRRLSTLSGGERRKAFIAQALAREPELLLLDEPTAHLDIRAQLDLLRLFQEWAGEGITVMATAHDLNLAATFPRVLLIAEGQLLADGSPDAVFGPENLRRAFGVEVEVRTDRRTGAVTVRYLVSGDGNPQTRGPENDRGPRLDIFEAKR